MSTQNRASTDDCTLFPTPARLARAALLAATFFLLALPLAAQDPGIAEETAAVARPRTVRLWVEVTDERGRRVDDLDVGDLEVAEAGAVLEALSVRGDTLREGGSRVVLYLDQALTGGATMRRATEALAAAASKLTALGDVELVAVDEIPAGVLTTRDELLLGERLSWTGIHDPGQGRIVQIRASVLDELRRLAVADATTTSEDLPQELARVVADGIAEELALVRERQETLVAYLDSHSDSQSAGPRIAIVVADGFDLDPVAFYATVLEEDVLRLVAAENIRTVAFETEVRTAAQALAALGWTVVALAPEGGGLGDDVAPTLMEGVDLQGGRSTGVGVTIRPGSIFKRRRDEAAQEAAPALASLVAPREALALFANASGGEIVADQRGVNDFLERFSRRYELIYTSPLDPAVGTAPLEVRGRAATSQDAAGLLVRASRFTSVGVPPEVGALRLQQILQGLPATGDLDLTALLDVAASDVEARLQLLDLDDGGHRPDRADFRVTVAVAGAGREPQIYRELRPGETLRGGEWQYRTSVDLPDDATDVAVLVEDLSTGLWGGARATVMSRLAEGELLRSPTLEVVRPEEELLRGKIRFETRIFDRRIDRVLFQLDERDVAKIDKAPFSARIDLGRSPRRQTLTAIAYDAEGEELGRDTVVLNAGSGGLEVRIVSPTEQAGGTQGAGPVDVEAEIAVPIARRLDRAIFFWNNEAVATLYGPPYRQRIVVPAEAPMGYVRVVAMLDDGTLAEDVLFLNGPRSGERVDVSLVELFVVVTDPGGRPVRGLSRDDFVIREEGRPQEISTFSDASDLPLTLGMAIDSSASMFVKLPNVQRAAVDFVRTTFGEQDRAFVVDFDSSPRLVRSTTDELDRVVRSIESLEASGRTALWESIVYSLVQLQGVRGRKALVVFSDGADEDDEFPFRSCLAFARKMGVPIYLILMRKAPNDPTALSLLARSFSTRVDRLVSSTGGRVFYAKEYDSLDAVYDVIEQELRSQYLLAYYPKTSRGSSWRDVDVAVTKRGLSPRTLSGYWP